MAIHIDLLNLTDETQGLLWRLVSANPERKLWAKGEELPVVMPDGSQSSVILSHGLLQRGRKPGKQGLPRLEVLSDKTVGSGAFGRLVRSLATLIPNPDKKSFEYSRGRTYSDQERARRLAKLIEKDPDSNPQESMQDLAREAELTGLVDHMKSKPLVSISEHQSALVMKHLAGEPLVDFLINEREGQFQLSIDQRFELSIAFVEALLEQVTKKGIVHKDIKPDNALVSVKNGKFKIKILDFGLSRKIDDPTMDHYKRAVGSPGYAALEVFEDDYDRYPITPACDVFAAGVTVGIIWRDRDVDIKLPDTRIARQYKNLFAGMGDFAKTPIAAKIRNLLKETLTELPKDRITAEKLLEKLRELYREYKLGPQNLNPAAGTGVQMREANTEILTKTETEKNPITIREKSPILIYREQLAELKKYIEDFEWDVHTPQRRPRFIMTEEGKKRVPYHVYSEWKKITEILEKLNASLSDYKLLEADILKQGKKTAEHPTFFRKESTQSFYNAHHAETLSELLSTLREIEEQFNITRSR